ncbi:phage tail protein [Priestia filamentosa]|uniref:phage tail protein n=1 Tax=Priestia filamentosa TaxID=1402861 RepID=UPI000A085B81|nr:phage tail protein [Priestia filamentosa]OXS69831.1 hypothetical protein B1B01_12835 [Priestia filamentosa]SMF36620.1 phage minor structural protein, N-terminal region [Priestia filamentosa]
MYVEDLEGNQYFAQGEVTRTRRVNGEKELSLTFVESEQNQEWFHALDHHWKVGFDEEEYVVIIPKVQSKGSRAVKSVQAIHRFFIDMRDEWVYETHSGSMTLAARLNMVFQGSGYTFQIIDSFYAQDLENFGDSSRLNLFQKTLEAYGAEFEVREKVIYLRKQIGRDTDFQYRHKFNLKDINVETNATDFATYIEGFGADGLRATYTSPLAEIYGIKHAPPVRDERYTIHNSLYNRLKQEVDNSLQLSINLDVSSLRQQGLEEPIQEGDRIFVIDERLNLDIEERIVEIRETFNAKEQLVGEQVTLSNQGIRQTYQVQLNDTVRQVKRLMTGRTQLPYNALDQGVQLATKALKSAQTELTFDNGILAVEESNPNHLVTFNSAGLGVSDDGGATFKEAITYEGINTNLLTAGQIDVNNVKIVGTDRYFFWDNEGLVAINAGNPNSRLLLADEGLKISADGGQTYSTAITGEGVKAEAIQAGKIEGVTIASDSTIDVATDLKVGYNVFLGDGNPFKPDIERTIHFNDEVKIGVIPEQSQVFGQNRLYLESQAIETRTDTIYIGLPPENQGGGEVALLDIDSEYDLANISVTEKVMVNFRGKVTFKETEFSDNVYFGFGDVEFSKYSTLTFNTSPVFNKNIKDFRIGGSSSYIWFTEDNEPTSNIPETGKCGFGMYSNAPYGVNVGGVGVNFRMRRRNTPTSVTLTTEAITGITTDPAFTTHLTRDGFFLYFKSADNTPSYKQWRGTYTVS